MDPLDFELKFLENADKHNIGSLQDGDVTTAKIAAGAVTSEKITDGAITTAKLAKEPIYLNSNSISSNYTVPANYNGLSSGPITIADGSSWSIV
jgi:hypothetical protein